MAEILIVDDERSIRVTLCAFLEGAGYRVNVAEDAEVAQQMLENGNYDVIVSDIVLPRVSGVALLQRIRRTAPAVQVIMITGEPTIETAADTVRLGASDYLAKPVGKNALLRSVANAVRVKRMDDERRALTETLRTKYAELEELAANRATLLHLLHHDVANSVSGAIALLERRKSSVEQHSSCEQAVLTMLAHCDSVIRDIRARETASVHISEPEAADLRALAEEACAALGRSSAAKRVEIHLHVEPGITVLVRPGPFVVHVLNNVLSNAIKFSYSGGSIDIEVTCEDSWASLSFRDHGCGIPHHRLARLFDDPFTTPGTAGEPGTGYGLRHVRQCVEDLGGSVSVVSTSRNGDQGDPAGTGTTVTIRIKQASEPAGNSSA